METAGKRRRCHIRETKQTVPAVDSRRFPQWTVVDLPEPYDGLSGYPAYFLVDCQIYFLSLEDPKPSEKQWLWFLLSRFVGPSCQWVQHLLAMGSRGLENVTQFVGLFVIVFGSSESRAILEGLFGEACLTDKPDLLFTTYYEQANWVTSSPMRLPKKHYVVSSAALQSEVYKMTSSPEL